MIIINDKKFKEKKPIFIKIENEKMLITGFLIGESKKFNYILINKSNYIKLPKKYEYEKANYLYLLDNELEFVANTKFSYSIYSLSNREEKIKKSNLYKKEIIQLDNAKNIVLKLLKSSRNLEEKERIKEEEINNNILMFNYTKFSLRSLEYKYADTNNKVFIDKYEEHKIEEYKEYNFFLIKKKYIKEKNYKYYIRKKQINNVNSNTEKEVDYDFLDENGILDLSNDDRFIPVLPKKEKKKKKVKK